MGAICPGPVNESQFNEMCIQRLSNQAIPKFKELTEDKEGSIASQVMKKRTVGDWEKGQEETGKGVIYGREFFCYEGEIKKGNAEGKGHIIWSSGNSYKGEFKNNQASGQGLLLFEKEDIKISGVWQEGLPVVNQLMQLQHQKYPGTIVFLQSLTEPVAPQSSQPSSIKDAIRVRINFQDGIIYQGQIRCGGKENLFMIEGRGKMQFKDGSLYEGDFERGYMQGQGKYHWGNTNHWYEGGYTQNLKHGEGVYHYGNKMMRGEWVFGELKKNLSLIKFEATKLQATKNEVEPETEPKKQSQDDNYTPIKQLHEP